MSGHSHWAGIKRKKEITDQKRGKVFSKLLVAISAAAKTEPDPNFNPRLRSVIEKSRAAGVPQDNIDRAIKRAKEAGEDMEELLFEAYGPAGVAIIIEALSNSKNRTVQEIKLILKDCGGKWAETGSVQWAFDQIADTRGSETDERGWKAKFPQEISEQDAIALDKLVDALEENDDVQNAYTSAA